MHYQRSDLAIREDIQLACKIPHRCGADADLLHNSFCCADGNQIPHCKLIFQQDEKACYKIPDEILCAKAYGKAADPCCGNQRGCIDVEKAQGSDEGHNIQQIA